MADNDLDMPRIATTTIVDVIILWQRIVIRIDIYDTDIYYMILDNIYDLII